MSSRQYIIPTKRLTFMEEKDTRLNAMAAGALRAIAKNIGAWEPKELGEKPLLYGDQFMAVKAFLATGKTIETQDIREWRNIDDAATALDQWRTAPLVAIDTEYSCFQAVPIALAAQRATKLVVFYKVDIDMTALNVSRLIFRRTAVAGIPQAQFSLEGLGNQEIMGGYFSEPQVWDPNTPYVANVLCRIATGVFDRVVLGAFVFETAGSTNA